MKKGAKRVSTIILLLIMVSVMPYTVVSVRSQQPTLPDELTFHYTKPNPVTGHCNPIIPGAAPFTPFTYEPLAKVMSTALVYANVYEGLIPILAKSWRWVDDTTFEVGIREEAHFRDGKPVTADDVVFSWDLATDPKLPGAFSWLRPMVVSFEKVDDKVARVLLKPDYAKSPLAYFFLTIPIVEKSRWERIIENIGGREKLAAYDNCDFNAYGGIDGTGPYTPIYFSKEGLYFKRDPNYWGEKIGLLFAPEYFVYHGDLTSENLFRMFDAHARDLTSMTAYMDPGWVLARSDYLTVWNPLASTPMEWWEPEAGPKALILNYARHPIFREQWFREALVYAINRTQVIEIALGGQARPLSLIPIHPTLYPNYLEMLGGIVNKTFECTVKVAGVVVPCYSPELAIKILQEHCSGSPEKGWTCRLSDGSEERLGPWGILYVSGWTEWARPVEVIVENLRRLGIDVHPEPVEYTLYESRFNSLDFDIAYSWVLAGTPIAGVQFTFTRLFTAPEFGYWWLGRSPVGFQIFWNGSFSPLPGIAREVASLADKLWRAPYGSPEFDETVKGLMELIAPQIPYIPLQYDESFHLHNYKDRWTNWPQIDDPYLYDVVDNGVAFVYDVLMHVYPVKVKLVSFELSSAAVKKGETITARVTLRNEGSETQRYKIVINLGPAKAGWELWADLDLLGVTEGKAGILAWKIVSVPPGEHTYEIPVKIDLDPGEYTLAVDSWRMSKWDMGKPIEQKIQVTATATTAPATTATPPAKTVTVTETVVGTVEKLTTVYSTKEVTQTVTDWTTAGIIGVVLLVIGIAIGYVARRRS